MNTQLIIVVYIYPFWYYLPTYNINQFYLNLIFACNVQHIIVSNNLLLNVDSNLIKKIYFYSLIYNPLVIYNSSILLLLLELMWPFEFHLVYN